MRWEKQDEKKPRDDKRAGSRKGVLMNTAYTMLCYAKCGTCRKAKKWLEEKGIAYSERPIREENPTREELIAWRERSGLPVRKLFNTSGTLYKEMQLKDKLPSMSEEEMFDLLATDGMLVKRPILLTGQKVLVGFKEEEWESTLSGHE